VQAVISVVYDPAKPLRRRFVTGAHVHKTKFTSLENYRLASRGDLVPLWSSKLDVNKNNAVAFYPDTKNNS
jgi:hypothetical protein